MIFTLWCPPLTPHVFFFLLFFLFYPLSPLSAACMYMTVGHQPLTHGRPATGHTAEGSWLSPSRHPPTDSRSSDKGRTAWIPSFSHWSVDQVDLTQSWIRTSSSCGLLRALVPLCPEDISSQQSSQTSGSSNLSISSSVIFPEPWQ